jgi:hypothetical protein
MSVTADTALLGGSKVWFLLRQGTNGAAFLSWQEIDCQSCDFNSISLSGRFPTQAQSGFGMKTQNIFGSDKEQKRQQLRVTDWTWEGASVFEISGTLDAIYPHVADVHHLSPRGFHHHSPTPEFCF